MRYLVALAAVGVGLAGPAWAGKNDILIGVDEKIVYDANSGVRFGPGKDALLVMDITNPAKPRIRASLPLMNSLVGPPTNLQITPDGKLALLANSVVNTLDGTVWKETPDDKLFVVDLTANPPKLVDTLAIGKQPSGLAISRRGDLALVANRAGKSVSVLSIQNGVVKLIGDVALPNPAAAIAITPDGKRAFICFNTINKVGVLAIDGTKVTYDAALDIPAGLNPYNVDITPNGRFAVVSGTGAGGNNGDAVMVIDATGAHPHVAEMTTPGNGPEGLAISPDGKWVVTPLLLGTGAKYSDWFYTKTGAAALMSLGSEGQLTRVNTVKIGGLPEGVAFSPRGDYVYVGNYHDRNLQVLRISNGKLTDTGIKLSLPGQPASIRAPAR
jgi:DNA-binding beta-propeller fold protein YncE